MMAEWLGWLGAPLLLLLLLSMVWLVGGFLADSIRPSAETTPDPPKTWKSLIGDAIVDGTIVLLWAYVLSGELRDAEGSPIFIGLLLFGIATQTYLIIRKLIEAFRRGSAEVAPPQA